MDDDDDDDDVLSKTINLELFQHFNLKKSRFETKPIHFRSLSFLNLQNDFLSDLTSFKTMMTIDHIFLAFLMKFFVFFLISFL